MTNRDMNIRIAKARGWTEIDEGVSVVGTAPNGARLQFVPGWTYSLDTAMELVDEMVQGESRDWTLAPTIMGEDGYAFHLRLKSGAILSGYGATPQEAICAAWLEWKGE